MAETPWEHAAEARAALNAIVTDPEHGVAALSSPRTMSNLLKDLLPDAPREKNLLVAAAEAGLADTLREHVSQGMDTSTAIRLTASSFSARSPLTPDACSWVTGEIAVALGISETNEAASGAGSPPASGPFGPVATEVSPGYGGYSPGLGSSAGAGNSAGRDSSAGSAADLSSAAQAGGYPPAPDGFPVAGDGYSRVGDSAPSAGGYGSGPAGVPPGPGAGAPSSYPPASPGYSPSYPQGAGSQPGEPGQPGYQPGAAGYSPPPAGYSSAAPGYSPPTAFAPAQNPQAYGPGVAAGMPAMPGYQAIPQPGIGRRSNTMAVTALVLGVVQFVGWIIFLLPGLLAAILAIVLGFVSMKQISRSGESGRGLAIAGVVLGFLGILIVGILVAVGVASVNSQS
jgi:hypothetical protein